MRVIQRVKGEYTCFEDVRFEPALVVKYARKESAGKQNGLEETVSVHLRDSSSNGLKLIAKFRVLNREYEQRIVEGNADELKPYRSGLFTLPIEVRKVLGLE